jgi:hypothetical protein
MATKLTKEDKEIIGAALMLKLTSSRRAANGNVSNAVRAAHEQDILVLENLRGKILGQQDLEI